MSTEAFVVIGVLIFSAVIIRNLYKVIKGNSKKSQDYTEHVHDQHSEGWSPDHSDGSIDD